ncbi:MAG: RagB/SusD family nutrient uptake outer membrane protein [Marinifilum sp.]|jgi:hypothetical protein|nr:RagB/SusD family nutrient uptake outer membrane protein [Marinifilum sp.]
MKKIYIIIVFFLAFFTACEDELDTTPFQSIDENDVFTSLSGFENAITGVYDGLQDADVYGANVIQDAEIKAQYVLWGGSFTSYSEISAKEMATVNAESTRLWVDGYFAINSANKVLDALASSDLNTPEFNLEKDRIKGEAFFARGILYYELVRNFGLPYNASSSTDPGVPIILKGTSNLTDAQEMAGRATVNQVYDQVISDLKEAEVLLPSVTNAVRASMYSAKAFLARVYLSKKDYTNASNYANEVIDNGGFSLDGNPASSFGPASTQESVFAIIHTSTDNLSNDNAGLNDYFSPLERADISIPQSTLDLFADGDLRLSSLFIEVDDQMWSNKWIADDANLPIIRLAEMYLISAESLYELGGSEGDASDMLNVIRNRASLDDITVTGTDLRDSIRMEFIREFIAEGHAVYDLQRWQLPVGFSDGSLATVPWNDPSLVFPIPQREIDVNPNLGQNPGY